jgi:predicted nucleic acid-binding protein
VPGVTLVEVFKLMVDKKPYGPRERQYRIRLFAEGLRDITEQLPFDFEDTTPSDFRRVSGILGTYADSNIDYVDAVVIAIAERSSTRYSMTVDQTDFRRYVNSSGEHFILPIFDS